MKKLMSGILALAILLFSIPDARAEGETTSLAAKRGMVIAKAALYGFGGGLVVGLASQVFKKKAKNIFVFGSLGMYAGILLGIYVVSTSQGPTPYEGPDTYDDFSMRPMVAPTHGVGIVARSERFDGSLGSANHLPGVTLQFLSMEF